MDEKLSPEALYAFFKALDSDHQDEQACEIHYACSCIVRRALVASEMLLEIKAMLGGGVPTGEVAPAGVTQEVVEGLQDRLAQTVGELQDVTVKMERILKQNLKLADENIRLEQKNHALQLQINRLVEKREMSQLLGRLEAKMEWEKKQGLDADSEEEGAGEEPASPVEGGESDVAASEGGVAEETPASAEPQPAAGKARPGNFDFDGESARPLTAEETESMASTNRE